MFDTRSWAALVQVCHDFGVPFGVVRAVSDRTGDEAHVDANSLVAEVGSACAGGWPALTRN